MTDTIQICVNCHSSTADLMFDRDCPAGGLHYLVDALVTDCPFTKRDKLGTFRAQWRQEANRQCTDDDHHFGVVAHVAVPPAGGVS